MVVRQQQRATHRAKIGVGARLTALGAVLALSSALSAAVAGMAFADDYTTTPPGVTPTTASVLGNQVSNQSNGLLPKTGAELLLWILVAALLITVGTVLVLAARRRRNAAA